MPEPISTRRSFMLATACFAGFFITSQAYSDGQEPMLSVKGELTYFQRIALPAQAVAFVEIRPAGEVQQNVAIAETRIELEGKQVPVPFLLELPHAHLQKGTTYEVSGGILIDNQPRWLTKTPVVLDISSDLFDAGTMVMTPQEEEEKEAPAEAANMRDTLVGEWRIVKIGDSVIAEDAQASLGFDEEGAFFGRLCNSFRGSYTIKDMNISFGQTAATLMACPDPLGRQEKALFSAFKAAASYQIADDGMLNLLDNQDRILVSAQQ